MRQVYSIGSGVRLCPLCQSAQTEICLHDRKNNWEYWLCSQCDLIFKDARHLLNGEEEKIRYDLHNNHIEDKGYVRFLMPVASRVRAEVALGSLGLDYGCGPGPVLAQLLSDAGFKMKIYDPYFAPDAEALRQKYDFVTCTEVAEHFYNPRADFAKLATLLRAEGRLFIMTSLHQGPNLFEAWHYRQDPTHVSFYSKKTFAWIANWQGWVAAFDLGKGALIILSPRLHNDQKA